MHTLAAAFGYPVGFSDHTLGIEIALAAAHRASLEPVELEAMVGAGRGVERSLGDGVKQPTPAKLRKKEVLLHKSRVAARDIKAGGVISERDINLRRASGTPGSWLPLVVGRVAKSPIKAGVRIEWRMLG